MKLTQLLYCSKALQNITENDTDLILKQSRHYNSVKNITGMLCNNEQYYIQLLEGSYREVNDLYAIIASDNRHSKTTILSYQTVDHRLFPNWSMGYFDDKFYVNDLIKKYMDSFGLLDLERISQACLAYMPTIKSRSNST